MDIVYKFFVDIHFHFFWDILRNEIAMSYGNSYV